MTVSLTTERRHIVVDIECTTDGCIRSAYLDGLCKRCRDLEWWKTQTANRKAGR